MIKRLPVIERIFDVDSTFGDVDDVDQAGAGSRPQ